MKVAPQLRGLGDAEIARLIRKGYAYLDGDTIVPVISGFTQASADFELGSNGSNITTGDPGSATAFDSITLASTCTATYDTAHVHSGTLAAKMHTGASGDQCCFGWTTALGSVSTMFGRYYMYVTASTPADMDHLIVSTGAGRAGYIAFKTDRHFDVRGDGAVLATSTNALPTNAWSRVEWKLITGASGTWEVKLFLGANADGATPDETIGPSYNPTSCSTGNITSFSMGNGTGSGHGNNPYDMWLDDIIAGAASYPGPTGGGGGGGSSDILVVPSLHSNLSGF